MVQTQDQHSHQECNRAEHVVHTRIHGTERRVHTQTWEAAVERAGTILGLQMQWCGAQGPHLDLAVWGSHSDWGVQSMGSTL